MLLLVASLYFSVIPVWRKESPMKVGLSRWMGPTLFRYLCCKIGVQWSTAQAETISQKAKTFSHQQTVSLRTQRRTGVLLELLPHRMMTECGNLARSWRWYSPAFPAEGRKESSLNKQMLHIKTHEKPLKTYEGN